MVPERNIDALTIAIGEILNDSNPREVMSKSALEDIKNGHMKDRPEDF